MRAYQLALFESAEIKKRPKKISHKRVSKRKDKMHNDVCLTLFNDDDFRNSDIVLADINNIISTLPILTTEQQEDVLKAEKRYLTDSGMLFTNGTGTGKTFTGIGIIKRFLLRKIDDIIIVVPNQKIASDWIKTAAISFIIRTHYSWVCVKMIMYIEKLLLK